MQLASTVNQYKLRLCDEKIVKTIFNTLICRAGATSPVGQVSTGPLFSPSPLTADLGDYDVRVSIDERSTGSTELAA